ncbi:collagen alpha-2(I) chain-like [Papilio machaon]|nr:collagen alpha-2(I) chain-like [Papilio machaon]
MAPQRSDIPPDLIRTNGIKLYGFNSAEFKEPQLIKDDCKEGKGEIVLEIKTSRIERLPISDFQPLSYVEASHQFSFVVGPICFS